MIPTIALAAALVALATLVGQAVAAAIGRPGAAWAPAAGFCVLLAVTRAAFELRASATWAAGTLILLAVTSTGYRAARSGALVGWRLNVPLALGVILVAAVPILVAGHSGILAVGNNDDMSAHLTAAWWLDGHGTPAPVSSTGHLVVAEGYPLGPHALAAGLARASGVSLVHSFNAEMLAVPALAALAALGLLCRSAPAGARVVGASLVALGYLSASYLAQGAFKETMIGMLLVAYAAALDDVIRRPGPPSWRAGLPLGVLAAGMVYVYSYAGLAWPVGTTALAVLATLAARPDRRAIVRAGLLAGTGAVGIFLLLAAPEIPHAITFASSSFAHEPDQGKGNLIGAIPAAETLGVWLRADFRFPSVASTVVDILDVLALLGLVLSVGWSVRRRQVVIPATLLATGAVAWQAAAQRNIYNGAKALAILAPIVMLTLAAGGVRLWSSRGRRPGRGLSGAARAILGVLAIAAVASSALALRGASVGGPAHEAQLRSLTRSLNGASVLYLGIDDYAQWELRGSRPATGPLLYSPEVAPVRGAKPWRASWPLDFDNFAGRTLDRYDYVLASAAAYRSTPPANFVAARRTPDYVLWRRTGRTPERVPLERGPAAGAIFDCQSDRGRRLLRHGGMALVVPRPVVVERSRWRGQPSRPGRSGRARVAVPAGRWAVSLQYVAQTGLTLHAPGLRTSLPATSERLGSFWPAGTLTISRPRTVEIAATARRPGAFGRLVGAPARTRPLNSPRYAPLGRLVLTRVGGQPELVPVTRACGRYVDWLAPAAGP